MTLKLGGITTVIVGNLVRDPDLSYIKSGARAHMVVAVTPRYMLYDRSWHTGVSSFLDVKVFGWYAENVCRSLHKGDLVIATGDLAQRPVPRQDGSYYRLWELTAQEIGPLLRYVTAQLTRSPYEPTPEQQERARGKRAQNTEWEKPAPPYPLEGNSPEQD